MKQDCECGGNFGSWVLGIGVFMILLSLICGVFGNFFFKKRLRNVKVISC